MDLAGRQQQIIAEFAGLSDWEARYKAHRARQSHARIAREQKSSKSSK